MFDRVMSQVELAELLGVGEERVSRTLSKARKEGRPLPERGTHPQTGRPGWGVASFVSWWRAQEGRRVERPATPLRRPELLEYARRGFDVQDVAEAREMDTRNVRRAAEREGVELADRWKRRRERCQAMAAQGLGAAEIAAKTGIPYSTVRRYLRQWRAGSADVAAGEPPRSVP
ncbi:helix-turn-helix domain-containing protein [Actinomadura violacea]|uniref:Helix-turn-helix domain-containing protein n=1 Tax=Actinomadura violacea TaxID=2819934 RepID=A0ABS3RXU7_9ACTN|nr:helix-turn-helix domain-containing protein [Actinomadura violacea]MBO2461585.1 helix-turn-helix domain-containing protein [Actinomadura violacea]